MRSGLEKQACQQGRYGKAKPWEKVIYIVFSNFLQCFFAHFKTIQNFGNKPNDYQACDGGDSEQSFWDKCFGKIIKRDIEKVAEIEPKMLKHVCWIRT